MYFAARNTAGPSGRGGQLRRTFRYHREGLDEVLGLTQFAKRNLVQDRVKPLGEDKFIYHREVALDRPERVCWKLPLGPQ